MQKKYLGFVVSHTHWDRAWYLPFQNYRLRLVRMMDDLLDLLERNSRYQSFMLDGQTVILEDYLAVRQHNRDRIAALVKAGRLTIGPWYTLPDLFLPCAESIVRNLQMGRSLSLEFGDLMNIGYVPDPFGHFAQLPQILRGFGISSFLFMRGADRWMEKTGAIFDWQAPDGSSVLAVYLRDGYLLCSALGHPAVFGRFDGHEPVISDAKKRISDALALLSPLQKEKIVLLPNGCDHMPPQPELPTILDALHEQEGDVELIHGRLADFLAAIRAEGIPHQSVQGDLIGNYHHPILLSVYSTRMYLKQQNRCAENLLIRIVEPLRACFARLFFLPEAYSFLNQAWRLLLRNHAHDDICGCSVDAVHREDEVRFDEVMEIGHELVRETLEFLLKAGLQAPICTTTGIGLSACTQHLHSDVFVFNPHPFPVNARVRVSVLFPNPGGEWADATPEKQLCAVSGQGNCVPLVVDFSEPRVARSAFLETTWGRRYHIALDVELAGMAYDVVHIFETANEPVRCPKSKNITLENARFRLWANQNFFSIFDKILQQEWQEPIVLEYETDQGDTYSFSSVPESHPRIARLQYIRWHPQKPDSIVAMYELSIPPSLAENQEDQEPTLLHIEVTISLLECDGISYEIDYENKAIHSRLRALFPSGFAADSLKVDGHFRIAQRSVPAFREPIQRPYPGEIPYDTFHQGEFAYMEKDDGTRVWLANRGNPEISLVCRQNTSWFALTLHRAVGSLSVYGGAIRQCQAGPEVPTPEAQCLRHFTHHVAWGIGKISETQVRCRALSFADPVFAQEMPYLPYLQKQGNIPRYQSFLTIENAYVALDSCRAGSENTIVLRVHNLSGQTQQAIFKLGFTAAEYCTTDLNEHWNSQTIKRVENGSFVIALRPFEIGTIILR